MFKFLFTLPFIALAAGCASTPAQLAADYQCGKDASGAVVSIYNTKAAPIVTEVNSLLGSVGNLTTTLSTDPYCAAALSSLLSPKGSSPAVTPTTPVSAGSPAAAVPLVVSPL